MNFDMSISVFLLSIIEVEFACSKSTFGVRAGRQPDCGFSSVEAESALATGSREPFIPARYKALTGTTDSDESISYQMTGICNNIIDKCID